jgi:hypothetical protein
VEASQSTEEEKGVPGQHWNSFAYVYVSTFSLVRAVVKQIAGERPPEPGERSRNWLANCPRIGITSFQAIIYGRYRSSADPRGR